MNHIFLAYSREDQAFARDLIDRLEAQGLELWYDVGAAQVGDVWADVILRAVEDSAAMVVLMSPASERSRWVEREILVAERAGIPIFPVLVKGDIPPRLSRLQALDARGGVSPTAVASLVDALQARVGVKQRPVTADVDVPAAFAPPLAEARRSSARWMVGAAIIAVLAVILVVVILSSGDNGGASSRDDTASAAAVANVQTATTQHLLTMEASATARFFALQTQAAATVSDTSSPTPGSTATTLPEDTGIESMAADNSVDELVFTLVDVNYEEPPGHYELEIIDNSTGQEVAIYIHFPPPDEVRIPQEDLIPGGSYIAILRTYDTEGNFISEAAPLTFAYQPLPTSTPPTTPFSTPSPTSLRTATVTPDISALVAQTVVGYIATDESRLSPAEAAEIVGLIQADNRDRDRTQTLLIVLNVVVTLVGGSVIASLLLTARRGFGLSVRRAHAHPRAHPAPDASGVQFEGFQAFISSSDADRLWVQRFVDELGKLGFEVWWYAKDAPGLPFGKEIKAAIFSTKVFVIVISPDSMASGHVEEEIRTADLYKRPIINVVYRDVLPTDRHYGLAKGADIDFTDPTTYDDSLEYLAQAIDHHLGLTPREEAETPDTADPPDDTPPQDDT